MRRAGLGARCDCDSVTQALSVVSSWVQYPNALIAVHTEMQKLGYYLLSAHFSSLLQPGQTSEECK
jgi:hypothetical protein